jgi:hypothetical protein
MTLKTRRPTGAVPWPLILVEGAEKSGKAQPLNAPIATPTGWTTMGALVVGDRVIGSDGKSTAVTAVHERGERDIYRLTFSDGATVEACDEHLWSTWTTSVLHSRYNKGPKKGQRNHRPAVVRTTEQIREMVLNGVVIHIPMTAPVEYDQTGPLPLDPYLLGLLLGDGCLAKPSYPIFTSGDPELFEAMASALPDGDTLTFLKSGHEVGIKGCRTTSALRELGLMGTGSATKFLPAQYMRATPADRLAVLQGLLDTDGGMEWKSITYTSVSPELAHQVQELVRSLGGSCSMRTKEPFYRDANGQRVMCKTAYRLTVRLPLDMCPFRLARKVARWEETRPTFNTPPRRTVRAVDYVGRIQSRCITVEAEDHLYLADGFVVTHNSFSLAVLSGSDKVGQTYWVDLGEGSQDEYGAVPGARYVVVEHEGTFASIYAAVQEIHTLAGKAAAAGEPPVVLGIDSMTAEWEWLKDWATDRAKGSTSNQKKLARDPNAEITVSANYWNDANSRHRKLMKLLMTFPGIAVMTARGKFVAAIGPNGQPIEGQKEYRVEGQKTLAFDASCWVRVSRDEPAVVIGARSVHSGVRPGRDEPQTLPDDWSLEWLIFEGLKCDPSKAHTRDLVEAKKERTPEQIRDEVVKPDTGPDRLRELYTEAGQLGYDSVIVANERNQEELLPDLIKRLGVQRRAQAPATPEQHRDMDALWREAADFGDAEERANFTRDIIRRPVDKDTVLTVAEADQVVKRLTSYIAKATPPADRNEMSGAAA